MALGPRLDLRQSQSLVMTPQLQQAIKLLALSNLEIEAFIGEALDANPLLELGDRYAPAAATDKPKRTFADVCAKVRGLADDLDFSRDPSPGRDIVL